jgi:hypothetical protein
MSVKVNVVLLVWLVVVVVAVVVVVLLSGETLLYHDGDAAAYADGSNRNRHRPRHARQSSPVQSRPVLSCSP